MPDGYYRVELPANTDYNSVGKNNYSSKCTGFAIFFVSYMYMPVFLNARDSQHKVLWTSRWIDDQSDPVTQTTVGGGSGHKWPQSFRIVNGNMT